MAVGGWMVSFLLAKTESIFSMKIAMALKNAKERSIMTTPSKINLIGDDGFEYSLSKVWDACVR
jgi:hypothetical protein